MLCKMVIFQWNKDLECGIELLDKQHKELIERANTFFIRFKCGQGISAAKECLAFLQQYILYHFQSEEAFMVDCGYPKYRPHQAIHKGVAKEVQFRTVKMEDSGFAPEEVASFYTFLCNWIKDHILVHDLEFSRYYANFMNKGI